MKKFKLSIIIFFSLIAVSGLFIYKLPAWFLGVLTSKYTENRLITREEYGSFWDGSALLVASDKDNKRNVPLRRIDWKVQLGLKNFVTLNVKSSASPLANITLQKDGLHVDNVNMSITMEQLIAFASNFATLGLFGDVNVSGSGIVLSSTNKGQIKVSLDSVGSAMSPLNPIGNYAVNFDIATTKIDVSSNSDSIVDVSGSGSLNGLSLNATVKPDSIDQMLQFMTMMGIPQGNGSYLLKVF